MHPDPRLIYVPADYHGRQRPNGRTGHMPAPGIPSLQQLGPYRPPRTMLIHTVPVPNQSRISLVPSRQPKFSGLRAPPSSQIDAHEALTQDPRLGRVVHVVAIGNKTVTLPRAAGIDGVI